MFCGPTYKLVLLFQAAHPNMRTYYFCSDTSKEMELWMRAMIGAALVHSEPVKRYNAEVFPDVVAGGGGLCGGRIPSCIVLWFNASL